MSSLAINKTWVHLNKTPLQLMLFKNGLEFLALIGALIGTLLDEMNMANCCAGLNNTPIAVQELI